MNAWQRIDSSFLRQKPTEQSLEKNQRKTCVTGSCKNFLLHSGNRSDFKFLIYTYGVTTLLRSGDGMQSSWYIISSHNMVFLSMRRLKALIP